MKLAFQIPIPLLPAFGELEDFHFALAHEVLHNREYARIYREMSYSGFTVLDNGIHENGEPLSMKDLFHAAWLCKAHAIIPPDHFFDTAKTLEEFSTALDMTYSPQELWPVIQGKTLGELMVCYSAYVEAKVNTICIPYRIGPEVRMQMLPYLDGRHRHHFLGYTTLPEVAKVARAPHASMDTGKPFRYAQAGRALTAVKPDTKLNIHRDCPKVLAYHNVMTLRKYANGAP